MERFRLALVALLLVSLVGLPAEGTGRSGRALLKDAASAFSGLGSCILVGRDKPADKGVAYEFVYCAVDDRDRNRFGDVIEFYPRTRRTLGTCQPFMLAGVFDGAYSFNDVFIVTTDAGSGCCHVYAFRANNKGSLLLVADRCSLLAPEILTDHLILSSWDVEYDTGRYKSADTSRWKKAPFTAIVYRWNGFSIDEVGKVPWRLRYELVKDSVAR